MGESHWLLRELVGTGVFLSVLLLLALLFRPYVRWLLGRVIRRVMSEAYEDNIWEMVTASVRVGPIKIIENSLRAHSGQIIKRPFGSPRKYLSLEGLMFSPAQLARRPLDPSVPIHMQTVIGPCAKKPLQLDTPLLAGGMGYAVGVSAKVKRAIARATAATGTATNTGEGLFLPDERALAKYLILQYTPASWSQLPEIVQQVDAIEIHIGQGATATASNTIPPEDLQGEVRETFGLTPGESLVVPTQFEELQQPEDLKRMVERLRSMTGGVPIGVKLCPGAELEADLDIVVFAGVDFISLDGSQAGTKGGAPLMEDDFGLPTIYALCRAVRHLESRGVKERVSLMVGGGFTAPGECLKALALGADAVYMGTAFLWAMSHAQIRKTMPWEPPTQLVYFSGSMKRKFNEEKAALHLENFIKSCTQEMEQGIRALGKSSVAELDREHDLVALDEITHNVTKVKRAY